MSTSNVEGEGTSDGIGGSHEPIEPSTSTRPPHPNLIFAILWSLLQPFAQLVVAVAGGVIATLIALGVNGPENLRGFLEQWLPLIQMVLGTPVTVLVAVSVCLCLFGRRAWRVTGWRPCSWPQFLLITALVVPQLILASEVANCAEQFISEIEPPWLESIRQSSRELSAQLLSMPWWAVMLLGSVLPALGEELYCRGFLSRGLVARYGIVAGTVFTAMLFAAMHLEPVQACSAFFLGVSLQFVFLVTRSLPAAILLHGLHNATVLSLWMQKDTISIPCLTGGDDGAIVHTPLILLVTAAVCAGLIISLLFQCRTSWQLPNGKNWTPGYLSAEIPDPTSQIRATTGAISKPGIAIAGLVYLGMVAALLAELN